MNEENYIYSINIPGRFTWGMGKDGHGENDQRTLAREARWKQTGLSEMLTFQTVAAPRTKGGAVQTLLGLYGGSGIGYVVWNLFFNSIQIRHL
jgi:hypothetical protein